MRHVLDFNTATESDDQVSDMTDLLTSTPNSSEDFQEVERSLVVLEHLIDVSEIIKAKKHISTEDLAFVRICNEMAVAGTMSSADQLLPSMESWSSPVVATEAIMEDVTSAIKRIAQYIGYVFKRTADSYQYHFTMFERQSSAVATARYNIKNSSASKFSIATKDSKYMHYGNSEKVKDFRQYLDKFKEVSEFCTKYNSASADFLKRDFMQSWKNLVSPLTGYDEKYLELFTSLKDFIESVTAISSTTRTGKMGEAEILRTPNYLGMSHAEICQPAKGSYDIKYAESCRRVHKYFAVDFIRDDKFETSFFKNTVVFDNVAKADILKALDLCDEIIQAYRKHLDLTTRLSQMGSSYVMLDAINTALYPPAWWKACLSNYRIMVRMSSIMTAMIEGAFVYARGNVAKCVQLANKAK